MVGFTALARVGILDLTLKHGIGVNSGCVYHVTFEVLCQAFISDLERAGAPNGIACVNQASKDRSTPSFTESNGKLKTEG